MIAEIWTAALCLGGATYLFFLVLICRGLSILGKLPPSRGEVSPPSVSVVIAARNEETEIETTLRHISAQVYPSEKLEIIVIDDRSTDRTTDRTLQSAQHDPRIRLERQTSIKPDFSPKKQALERGILSATGEVIVTTDADCRPESGWLRELVGLLTPEVGMVAGQSRFDIGATPPLWQRLQALDFQAIGVASAGLIAVGMPFTCTGASLCFRMSLYDEIGGWKGVDRLISGDDELLLVKASSSRWKIVAATGPAAIVPTRPPESLSELWRQRVRWGSKGLYYRPSRKAILFGVFLFYLGILLGPVVAAALGGSWILLFSCAAVKMLADFTALSLGSRLFCERFSLMDFLLLELIHPALIVVLAISGHVSSFEWKNQRFRSRR